MAFHVRDKETDALVRELALKRGVGLTEAVRLAVRRELQREEQEVPLKRRLRAIRDDIAALPKSGLQADKAFFDDLSGQPD